MIYAFLKIDYRPDYNRWRLKRRAEVKHCEQKQPVKEDADCDAEL